MKAHFTASFFILLCSFCAGCAPAADSRPVMPKEYLGYWQPMTKTLAGVGVDIQPGIIYFKDDPDYYNDLDPKDLGIREAEEYKVVHIGNDKVLIVTKRQETEEWLSYVAEDMKKQLLRVKNEPSPEEWAIKSAEKHLAWALDTDARLKPSYGYVVLSINIPYYDPDQRNLDRKGYGCALTEEDWNLPVSVHRERILSGYCTDKKKHYGGVSSGTWFKELD